MLWFVVITCAALVHTCKTEDYYTAAIVEYSPINGSSPLNTILENLKNYKKYAEKGSIQNTDIIVFPEYGLTRLIVDPQGYAIDFSKESIVLQELSSLARDLGIYIVVNLLEEVQEGAKKIYYNTNLVYDRKGQIIAKYRKINLYDEPNLASGNETVTFSTDFGVTFALFTCMDILYGRPSRTVLSNKNVTDIIFPTAWHSTMPFYTALTMQHSYSIANGVNLLAANYNSPKEGLGGSGIYLTDGQTSEMYIDDISASKMIVRNVKKSSKRQKPTSCWSPDRFSHDLPSPQQKDMSGYFTYRDFQAQDYTFKSIDLSAKNSSTKICHGKFCCNFTLSVAQPAITGEVYKLMAYDGEVIYDRSPAYIRVCSLVVCKNETNDSCGDRISGSNEFMKIVVEGSFEKNDTTFYTPLALNSNLRPVTDISYCALDGDGASEIHLSTYEPQKGILVFGIFGRVE